jgi:hypothetical protein
MNFAKNLVALLNRLLLLVTQMVVCEEQRQICFQSNHRFLAKYNINELFQLDEPEKTGNKDR